MDINVLLIAADPGDARVVEEALGGERGAPFHVQWVRELPEDLASLGYGATNVVLLDLALPDVQGIGALDSLLLAAPHIPILVFSGTGDEDLARQAMQRGAQDYLPRNHLDGYSLPRALRNVIDRKAAEEALFLERERARVTLDSIGDAVLSTDFAGNVTYLNSIAEQMTGWSREEAMRPAPGRGVPGRGRHDARTHRPQSDGARDQAGQARRPRRVRRPCPARRASKPPSRIRPHPFTAAAGASSAR